MNLDRCKLLMVTGKGGVGKSVVAALIAARAAKMGKRVCVVQCASDDQIGPLFGKGPIGHEFVTVRPKLDVINLSTELNFRDFIVNQAGMSVVFDKIFNQKVVKSFLGVIPGLLELALIGRFHHMLEVQPNPYDIVIFDAFASGHFRKLMTTPKAVFESGVIGPVLSLTQKIDAYFRDEERCRYIMVTQPEQLILSECLEFASELVVSSPVKLGAIVINRFMRGDVEGKGSSTLNAYLQKRHEKQVAAYKSFLTSWNEQADIAVPQIHFHEFGDVGQPLHDAVLESWTASVANVGAFSGG
jgi:arsenite-transporting ATPase